MRHVQQGSRHLDALDFEVITKARPRHVVLELIRCRIDAGALAEPQDDVVCVESQFACKPPDLDRAARELEDRFGGDVVLFENVMLLLVGH